MVPAASASARARAASSGVTPIRRSRRPRSTYVLIAIPILLAGAFVWQIGATLFHTDVLVRQAVAIGQVSLEPDPVGARVYFVVVDRNGQDTSVSGNVAVSVREPDGTVWQTSRSVSSGDFAQLPDTSVLAGRTGFSVQVPASDWARPPRKGGLATVSIDVSPNADGAPISTVTQERFP